jgi:cytochrome c
MKVGIVVALASLLAAPRAFAGEVGDITSGQALFAKTCQTCHSIEIGVNKIGPSLRGIYGRLPASIPDFPYSAAMKAQTAPWTVETLDAYLANPREDVHGVKMFFKGLPDPRDRANVIAYMETLR